MRAATDHQPQVVLRYFNCRGRAQPFRYLFIDAAIPFTDVRLSLADAQKDELPRSGPFASLPVLEWNGTEVGQTLAIASFLARKLGHYHDDDVERASFLDMVTAGAYLEMLHPYGELVTQPLLHPGSDGARFTGWFARRLLSRPMQLEQLLGSPLAGAQWFGGDEPVVADYMVFTVIRMGLEAAGEPFAAALVRCPKLAAHYEAMLERPRLREYLEVGQEPRRLTLSPHEPEIFERLRDVAVRAA